MSQTPDGDRRKLTIAEKRDKALQLRLTGATYQAIANVMKVNKSTVKRWIDAAIDGVDKENAAALIRLENERLNAAQRAIWPQVLNGQLGAVDRLVKIMERRARLNGLDAPQRVDLGASDVDLAAVAAEIEAAARLQHEAASDG